MNKAKTLKFRFHEIKRLIGNGWKNAFSLIKSILWYILLILTWYFLFKFQRINALPSSEYSSILNVLVSTISITTAIIISFLFSKLYSEKTERINRKVTIDGLSKKLTALRKIVHFLRESIDFWRLNENIKNFLDFKYKSLTLCEYDKMGLDGHTVFHDEVNFGELEARAYLGLKEIEGKFYTTQVFYDRLLRKNYTLDELIKIQASCRPMWAFMDEYYDNLPDVKNLPFFIKNPLKENLKIVYPDFKVENLNNETIKDLFNDFPEELIRKQYYLTLKNNQSFGRSFNALLLDLLIFVILIIAGVLILSFKFDTYCKMYFTNIISSGFIVTVIDLLVNVIVSIRKELKVTDFYDI